MNKRKIINDPVYGFISIPYPIIFDLMEHPYFQRLRRIKQVGMTDYVYPGALHTRFHHALGALHLMTEAIEVLRAKGTEITEEEAKAVSIAIMLHDIGHGPFSHVLEKTLVNIHHEELSLLFMKQLNEEFDGALTLAIKIFTDQYPKQFLHQLVSGQLDMDRLDYLTRDSFFTGVYEGVVGYDRLIKMLAVKDGELVVEEKGIFSIEKFLISRRIMYWQVYLHKTVISAEQMLVKVLERAKMLRDNEQLGNFDSDLAYFLNNPVASDIHRAPTELLKHFANLDDYNIMVALKKFAHSKDKLLSYLSASLLDRQLFKVELKNKPFKSDYLKFLRQSIQSYFDIPFKDTSHLLIKGKETNRAYNRAKDEIKILLKTGEVLPMSAISDFGIPTKIITRYYVCYPKNIF